MSGPANKHDCIVQWVLVPASLWVRASLWAQGHPKLAADIAAAEVLEVAGTDMYTPFETIKELRAEADRLRAEIDHAQEQALDVIDRCEAAVADRDRMEKLWRRAVADLKVTRDACRLARRALATTWLVGSPQDDACVALAAVLGANDE